METRGQKHLTSSLNVEQRKVCYHSTGATQYMLYKLLATTVYVMCVYHTTVYAVCPCFATFPWDGLHSQLWSQQQSGSFSVLPSRACGTELSLPLTLPVISSTILRYLFSTSKESWKYDEELKRFIHNVAELRLPLLCTCSKTTFFSDHPVSTDIVEAAVGGYSIWRVPCACLFLGKGPE